MTAIIGPSGCGKSTLVRCINRLHEAMPGAHGEGELHLDERQRLDSTSVAAAPRRRHGLPAPEPVPDDVHLRQRRRGPELNGGARRPRRDASRRPCAAPALWDEVKDRLSRARRRPFGRPAAAPVHRARAGRRAAVLLMDEPCSALDPIATPRIEELIDELKHELTIVIVTHNMQQAARVADGPLHAHGELVE